MKSFDTGYSMRTDINPRRQGDYLIFGKSIPLPGGLHAPVLYVERVAGLVGVPLVAVEEEFLNVLPQTSEWLAQIIAIGIGKMRLEQGRVLC